ncbi:MAG: hypothetical protein B6245_19695 [Desulfobacteraceae bacterium 4572_88]|nr:MAG: hypothetical protein B6245_19695 [Desulfobacteraceae bacterium 4572_88]RLC00883.1 MAG: hypothetical protein DRI57_31770 [Deltaproteobacteria bacterium]
MGNYYPTAMILTVGADLRVCPVRAETSWLEADIPPSDQGSHTGLPLRYLTIQNYCCMVLQGKRIRKGNAKVLSFSYPSSLQYPEGITLTFYNNSC